MLIRPSNVLKDMLVRGGKPGAVEGFEIEEEKLNQFLQESEQPGVLGKLDGLPILEQEKVREYRYAWAAYMALTHPGWNPEMIRTEPRPVETIQSPAVSFPPDKWRGPWRIVVVVFLALIFAILVKGQTPHDPLILRTMDGVTILSTRQAGLLVLKCSTGMSCSWANNTFTMTSTSAPAPAAWGAITGTLSSQTDLQAALDAKDAVLSFSSPLVRTVNTVACATCIVSTGSYADPAWLTSLAKSKVGLGSVENTALSTWPGSANITTLGTVIAGSFPYANLSGTPSTFAPSAHNLLSTAHGDTVAASPVLGDLLFGNLTPAWTKLAGNTSAVRKVLSQTGTGAVSASPAWEDPVPATTCTGTDKVSAISVTGAATCTADETGGGSAHDILSATHTDSTPAAVSRGAMIVAIGAVPKWESVPAGVQNHLWIMGVNEPAWTAVPTWNQSTTGNAATATALAANPADCAANQFATTIAATGALTCAAITDADVPNTITVDLAATATALAANGANCTAGNFPLGVDASGAAETCTALPTTISGTANEITASAATGPVTLSIATQLDLSGKEIMGGAAPLKFEGLTDNNIYSRIAITDPTVSDKTFTIPNADSVAVQPDTGAANNFLTAISALGVISKAQPAFSNLSGSATDAQVPDTITVNLAGAATALASDPTDCSANQFANAIAASGNLTCAQPATADLSDSSVIVKNNQGNTYSTGAQDLGSATSFTVPTAAGAAPTASGRIAYDSTSNTLEAGVNAANKTIAFTDSNITGNAGTATALASDPSDCSANQFAQSIAASGNLTCSAIADADVPNNITIDLAVTATALASNPSDCAAGQYATTIAASGNLTCTAISDGELPASITRDSEVNVQGGAGLASTGSGVAPTLSTASGEADFLASGALVCGAGTRGKAQIHTTPLQYCDNAATPTLQYAAYGSSTGVATSATALAADPADCSAGDYAHTIAASGNLTCSRPMGIALTFAAANTATVTDGATYYAGCPLLGLTASAAVRQCMIPVTGTVKSIYVNFLHGAGTAETSTVSFRLNNTDPDTTISSAVTNDAALTKFSATGLSIAVTAGDFYEIKWVAPTWATNPTNVSVYGVVYIE